MDLRVDENGSIHCRAAEIESRALGEPYCEAEWLGEISLGGPPPPSNPYSEVTLFSFALTKHLPVLLPTRTVRFPNGRDVVIRQHQRREEERIGTGGVLWEAAIVLADYVMRNTNSLAWKGKKVLELGAGTGLVAIALAIEGADVCATDGNPRVLEGANVNIEDAATKAPFSGSISLDVFDWNSADHLAKFTAKGPWDVILGSDLVYPGNAGKKCVDSNALSPPADETLISLLETLSAETTTIIMALKDRTGELERFNQTISRYGWSMQRASAEAIMPEFRAVQQVAVLHLEKKQKKATLFGKERERTVRSFFCQVAFYHVLDLLGISHLTFWHILPRYKCLLPSWHQNLSRSFVARVWQPVAMVVNVLMVAEKPSIAQTLADALSSNHKYSTRTGVSWLTRQVC